MEQTHCVDSARQYKTMKEVLGKNKSLAPCISCFRITTTTTTTTTAHVVVYKSVVSWPSPPGL
jgi:hypothetical protein